MSLDISLTITVDTGGEEPYEVELYNGNYTHNVGSMWRKAGVYDALYNSAGVKAGELIDVLVAGWRDMNKSPAEYRELNPPNGWGDYDSAATFLADLIWACQKHPKAIIEVSR